MESITLEQAVALLEQNTAVITDIDNIPLLQVSGRILAQDMKASFDNPSFDRSPVDGYACRAADVEHASKDAPARLSVKSTQASIPPKKSKKDRLCAS